MTPNDCTREVSEYLRIAGGAELPMLRLDLGRRWTVAQLRAALKACGAEPYKSKNRYESLRTWSGAGEIHHGHTLRGFTMWRVPTPNRVRGPYDTKDGDIIAIATEAIVKLKETP